MSSKPDHRHVTTNDDSAVKDEHVDDMEILQADSDDPRLKEETDVDAEREFTERLMRMQAEFENYKKRVARDMASARERATDGLILEILPLYDNVLRAVHLHEGSKDGNDSAVLEGLQQIERQFSLWLESKGIQPICAVGDLFDPQRHEAVLTAESDRPRNEILEEFESGYFRYDRVLRPSKVSVSRGAKEEESS